MTNENNIVSTYNTISTDDAFNLAIERGLLSAKEEEPSFAGNYMSMGVQSDNSLGFKNIVSRQYLFLKPKTSSNNI